jgi:hypothetical protein
VDLPPEKRGPAATASSSQDERDAYSSTDDMVLQSAEDLRERRSRCQDAPLHVGIPSVRCYTKSISNIQHVQHCVACSLVVADRHREPCRTNLSLQDSNSGPLRFLNDLWGRFSYQYYSATLCCCHADSCIASSQANSPDRGIGRAASWTSWGLQAEYLKLVLQTGGQIQPAICSLSWD